MKYLRYGLIFAILVVLPLGSWYFLKSGLEWRKSKLITLEKKMRFLESYDFSVADKTKLYELSAHKTNVVKCTGEWTDKDAAVLDQYKKSKTFQYLVLSKNVEQPLGWSSKMKERYYKPQQMGTKIEVMQHADYLLVDTSGFVRQIYKGMNDDMYNSLVEDIAILLPRKKPKDIVVKKK